jgi:hypothetical protein
MASDPMALISVGDLRNLNGRTVGLAASLFCEKPAPPARGVASETREGSCHMTLVHKPADESDFGEIWVAMRDHILSAIDTHFGEPPMWRKAHRLFEGACKMAARDSTVARELRECGIPRQICLQECAGPANLPRSEAS